MEKRRKLGEEAQRLYRIQAGIAKEEEASGKGYGQRDSWRKITVRILMNAFMSTTSEKRIILYKTPFYYSFSLI